MTLEGLSFSILHCTGQQKSHLYLEVVNEGLSKHLHQQFLKLLVDVNGAARATCGFVEFFQRPFVIFHLVDGDVNRTTTAVHYHVPGTCGETKEQRIHLNRKTKTVALIIEHSHPDADINI